MEVAIETKKMNLLNRQENILLVFIGILVTISLYLNEMPKDIFLLSILLVFLLAIRENLSFAFFIYLFLVLYENQLVFSFSLSLTMIAKVLLTLLCFLSAIRANKQIPIVCLLFLLFLASYGCLALLFAGMLSGISLAFDAFLAIYFVFVLGESEIFWQRMLFVLLVGALFSLLAGFIGHYSGSVSNTSYLGGGIYIPRLRIPAGIDRAAFCLCTGMLYPLLWMRNGIYRTIIMLILITACLMTMSITVMGTLFVMFGVYFIYRSRSLKQKLISAGIILLLLILFIYAYNNLTGLFALDNFILRLRRVSMFISQGDYISATSGRFDITKDYIAYINRLPNISQIFGTFIPQITGIASYSAYSHNSFIDWYLYTGYFGIIILFIYILWTIYKRNDKKLLYQIVMLKMVFIVSGLGVSALTSNYWFIFLLL